MVWKIRRILTTRDHGLFHIRVDFWLNQAALDEGRDPSHSEDFINDCALWPDVETVRNPYDSGSGRPVPRELVMRGPNQIVEVDGDTRVVRGDDVSAETGAVIEWREEQQAVDRPARIQQCISDYVATLRSGPGKLLDNRLDNTLVLKTVDPMLDRPEIQQLKVGHTTDDIDDKANIVQLVADLSRLVDGHP